MAIDTGFHDISFDDWDEIDNPGPEATDFDRVVESAISRRGFLRSGAAAAGFAFADTSGLLAPAPAQAASRLGFDAVPANSLDTVTLPKGYNWDVLVKWGDPMWSDGAPFVQATRGTGAGQERAFGDNNDGMFLFSDGNIHVLAVNNEYTNRSIIYGNRETGLPENADDIRKGKAAHGVAVLQVHERRGRWDIVKDSFYNRKIMPDTPVELTGPARGHELMKTAADPSGTTSLGTWNNCGAGRTPWGTYLTCEENFNAYFSSSAEDFQQTGDQKRYGLKDKDWGYGWAKEDERFDLAKHPNEPHRAGYVVEVDPFDPRSTPKKRTALGRFKHENAEVVVARNGQMVVYMGDDERGEFLYRFVSDGTFSDGGDNSGLLETGRLYAAKFKDDQTGEWIELTPASTGLSSMAEICIRTRQAASAAGATTMDRPEWVAANPTRNEVYCCLTNNKNRGRKPNAGGDATPVNGPNPREVNRYGQIVRWTPEDGDHTANAFSWDLFVLAGNPSVHQDERAGSQNVTRENMFNSPDGLAFDSTGLLWIQTDGKTYNGGDYAGMGNNQMLAGDPDSGEIRRFMVGPKECEITGLTWSPDKRTMFAGIQHPGDKGNGHFPDGGQSLPRSCIIAIKRDDGGFIG